jgi:hypothetical protein
MGNGGGRALGPLALVALVPFAACSAPTSPARRSAVVVAPPPSAHAVAPSAPGPGVATAVEVLPEAPALAALDLTFSLAAEGPSELARPLHRLGDALLFQLGATYAKLEGDRLVLNRALARAAPVKTTALALLGSFPDPLWAQLDDASPGSDRFFGALYRLRGGRFQLVHKTGANVAYDGSWFGGDGRIGAVSSAHVDDQNQTWIEVLDGPRSGAVPKPAALPSGQVRVALHASLAFPTGELFVLGLDKASADTPSAVERWERGRVESVIERVPIAPPAHYEGTALFGRSASEVFVGGQSMSGTSSSLYLARFDGKAWSRLEVPDHASSAWRRPCFAVGDDGAVWALRSAGAARLELVRRGPEGAWAAMTLPASAGDEAVQIVARGASDVWIVGASSGRLVVLRSGPIAEPLRF